MILSSVMKEYFEKPSIKEINYISENKSSLVKVKKTSWQISEKLLSREYKLKTRKQKEAFIVEILKYLRECTCTVEFSCKNNIVSIVIYAISPYISEIELECAKDIDKIKKDITYYFASES